MHQFQRIVNAAVQIRIPSPLKDACGFYGASLPFGRQFFFRTMSPEIVKQLEGHAQWIHFNVTPPALRFASDRESLAERFLWIFRNPRVDRDGKFRHSVCQ